MALEQKQFSAGSQPGVQRTRGGRSNILPPKMIKFSSASNNGTAAVTKKILILNNDLLGAAETNNGSGASSISHSFSDGASGKIYTEFMRRFGGLPVSNIKIIATKISTGSQTSAAFAGLNLQLNSSDGQGNMLPDAVEALTGFNPENNQSGVVNIPVSGLSINQLQQLSFNLPKDTQLDFILTVAGQN